MQHPVAADCQELLHLVHAHLGEEGVRGILDELGATAFGLDEPVALRLQGGVEGLLGSRYYLYKH